MRHKEKIVVPTDVIEICKALQTVGHTSFPVGGCVRDVVLKLQPKDWDIATSADLETCLTTLSKLPNCIDIKPTGETFPVCRITFNSGAEYEVATFRVDQGLGKETTFTYGTIEDDVQRRDLTINAMFYDIETQEVVDLVGGYADLNNKLIKFVGDPDKRIAEDPSRVQRAIRMAIRFGFDFDATSKQALCDLGTNIVSTAVWGKNKVHFERVFIEFRKAEEHNIAKYFAILHAFNMLDQFFPGLKIEKTAFDFSDIRLVVASLLRTEDPKKIRKILVETCKWPDHLARTIAFLVEATHFNGQNVAKLIKSFSGTNLSQLLLQEFVEKFMAPNLAKMVICATNYTETISGDALVAQGFKGKTVGDKKIELEDIEFLKFYKASL